METVTPLVDRLASLLEYPDRSFPQRLAECRASGALEPPVLDGFRRFDAWASRAALRELQEAYTATFDLNAGCTLDIGWHLFGERHERGAFLADLRSRLASAGIGERDELPDYLPHVLRLLARMTGDDAALYAAIAPGVEALVTALTAAGNPYAYLVQSAVAAVRPPALMGA